MKSILNFVEKIKPTFSKGGKLGFLHSTFDAFETFLFVPNTVTKRSVLILHICHRISFFYIWQSEKLVFKDFG